MLNFKMNMPFYLMVFYGSMMIIATLSLRGLLKSKLPKFVLPILWSVILLRLLIPFSLSSPLSMKVPAFALDIPFESASIENTAVAEDIPVTEPDTIAEVTVGTADMIAQEAQDIPFGIAYSGYDTRNFYLSIIVFAYFAGLLATAGILISSKYKYTKHLKNSLLVEHNETINTILREMDMGHIMVFTNDAIASPLVCGMLAPKIYLPTRMDFDNSGLLRHILCHETMHIRRKDNWIKFVMILALCIHWFNPLVWIMSRYLASDLEMACDEAVLRLYDKDDEVKKSYAFSLLAMAITGNRPTLLYSAFSKTEVEKRIQNILHYRRASALLLAFSVCLVLSGSVVFATSGQAPFSPYLTAFCSSDSCRWGVQANLARGISLDKNAGDKAEKIIFDIMHEDTTNDPDILNRQILNALSKEFHVETGAFVLDFSLCLNREELFEEYEQWGLVRKENENDVMLYNGESIRTYSDKMVGRYMSQPKGAFDITVDRNRLGYITAVHAFHEGDTEYDRRTRELEQSNRKYSHAATGSYGITETAENVVESYQY